jgi:hypothetical protein
MRHTCMVKLKRFVIMLHVYRCTAVVIDYACALTTNALQMVATGAVCVLTITNR